MSSVIEIKLGFTAEQMFKEGRTTKQDVDLIKNWIPTENLPKITDEQVIQFLLSCCNNHELTKATIRAFYDVRSTSKLFSNRNIHRSDLQQELNTGSFCIFPKRTDDGCVVVFHKFEDFRYQYFDFTSYLTLLFMTLEAAIYDNPPTGLILLFDMEGFGLMHLTKLSVKLLKMHARYFQEGLPVSLKNVHILNSVYFVDKLTCILKPFVKADILNKIHFHSCTMTMEEFHKTWIAKECLPEDYDGTLPPVDILRKENITKLTNMQDFFEAEEKQRKRSEF